MALKMLENALKVLLGVSRSKPFMLFVIILLTGFIYLHFSEAGSQMGVSSHAITPPLAPLDKFIKVSRPGVVTDKTNNQVLLNDSLDLKYHGITQNRKCKKKINVSFLKVHKAGSTTIMNIFLRFAISNKLNIVLPPNSQGFGFNYLGYGKTVSKKNIVPLPSDNESYNILCNHVVYNKTAFRSIMPEDTVYVGILREPQSHFRSAASYYGFYKHLVTFADQYNFDPHSAISQFFKNTDKFKISTYFVHNRMSFDFGIPKELFHNESFVDAYIEELGRDYGLVMIMEEFHESLVLLKRLLCWSTKDILYVPLNARSKASGLSLTSQDLTLLKQWNSADFKLYDHFNREFEAKLTAGGNDLVEEVESFKTIQEMVRAFCTTRRKQGAELTVPGTKWEESFVVTSSDCSLMTESELPMMQRLIKNAWARYDKAVADTVFGNAT